MDRTGLRDDIGSWKIIDISRPRILLIRARCFRRSPWFWTIFAFPRKPFRRDASFWIPARRLTPWNQISPDAMRPGGEGIRYIIERRSEEHTSELQSR